MILFSTIHVPTNTNTSVTNTMWKDAVKALGPVSPTTVNFNRWFSLHFNLQLA